MRSSPEQLETPYSTSCFSITNINKNNFIYVHLVTSLICTNYELLRLLILLVYLLMSCQKPHLTAKTTTKTLLTRETRKIVRPRKAK